MTLRTLKAASRIERSLDGFRSFGFYVVAWPEAEAQRRRR